MSKLRILAGLLMVLAGCSTTPLPGKGSHETTESFNDVDMPMENEHITESQPLAPPPGIAQPTAPANHIAPTWVSLKQWAAQNNIGPVQRISSGSVPTFALRAPRGLLIVRANEQIAYWNSTELHLGFAPRFMTNEIFIEGLDISKNVEPLMHPLALPANTNRVIVIDPGHGGSNTGTTSVLDGSHEKEYTLDWAKRLATILTANGWKVFLTRSNDADIPLTNRVSFADSCKADVFISLHFNAPASAKDQGEVGIETYCVTPTGMPSTLKRDYEDNTALIFPNNHFDADNLRYAMRVQRSILKVTAAHDRGVCRARFMTVLRGQNRPAILVEGGYLSNPREARHIQDPAYRQKLAEAVAAALIEKPAAHVPPPPEHAATTNSSPAAAVETAQKAKTGN